MAASPQRLSLLVACAVLLVAVAMVVAVGVVPPVRVATAPDIAPESAVPAFWVNVGLQLLAASVLLLVTLLSKRRSRVSTSGLVVTGIVVLFLGFTLSDAALAFREVGMQTVTTLLFLCVAADVLVGVLTIATALIHPKRTREGLTSTSA